MELDLRTIYAVCGTTCFVLGLLQMGVFLTRRFGRWPLWWSASNVLTGVGALLVASSATIPQWLSIDIGNALQVSGYLLMIVAVRSLTLQAIDWRMWIAIIVVATVPMVFLVGGSHEMGLKIVFASLVCLICDIAMASEARQIAGRERLYSAWLLMSLYLPTALVFAWRAGHYNFVGKSTDLLGQAFAWLAMLSVVVIVLRSVAVVLLAAERSQRELAHLAHHDHLTGTLNRAGFLKAFNELKCEKRALLLIDIDHFKKLNDVHGHAKGDTILAIFADVARSVITPTDIIGRHGGDEFVVVFSDRDNNHAGSVAERIREEFAKALVEGEKSTLCVGVAAATDARVSFGCLLQKADEALYRSKEAGRNRVTVGELIAAA